MGGLIDGFIAGCIENGIRPAILFIWICPTANYTKAYSKSLIATDYNILPKDVR